MKPSLMHLNTTAIKSKIGVCYKLAVHIASSSFVDGWTHVVSGSACLHIFLSE